MTTEYSLQELGWRPFFQAQIEIEAEVRPARVCVVHRDRVGVLGDGKSQTIELTATSASLGLTVGDWVLLGVDTPTIERRLEPFALFRRRSAGTAGEIQSIAANVDTLFIITSANRDFNVARLERFLAIAHEAGAFPIIVITKADLAEEIQPYTAGASKLSPGVLVEAVDARKPEDVSVLAPWCVSGQTVALLGSSGVGKSTLINTLANTEQETYAVRDDDQRGRHTTTGRSMHGLPGGGWLIDTPGMRELQLVDVGAALDDVFQEITALSENCRFSNCSHETEPGCAVQSAIDAGRIDAARLRRYRKLQSEDRRNTESLAERRARDKFFGKLYKSVQADKRKDKGEG